jgi:hypothetical protein
MSTPTVLVRASPLGGYRWRVIVDGETAAGGDALTEFEARNAANEIVKRLEQKLTQAP